MTNTLVPKEPTEAMLSAARDWSLKKYNQGIGNDAAIGCYKAMLSATPEPDAVVLHFHHATTPPVKPGSKQSFIVLTEREGRKASFAAHYLNQYPLEYEDGCEAPECAEGKHEDGCPTTGWFYDESNFDYDHCYFRLDGTVLAWAPIPRPVEIFAAKSSDDAVKDLVEAALALANAADGVGVAYFDTDTMGAPEQRMQEATLALRAALRTFLKEGE